MKLQATKKVPGGKMLRLALEHNDDSFTFVKITGDFFIHPEESIVDIENHLQGMHHLTKEHEIRSSIEELTQKNNITMIGISPLDIAESFTLAFKSATK